VTRRTSLNLVLDTLRNEILSGALRPGDPVNENVIAARLGVSHTPVREAIMDLIGEGFVESGPNRRRHVAHYSPGRAVAIVQLQGLLHQFGLLRIAETASGSEIDELADRFADTAHALVESDGPAIDTATARQVLTTCRLARHTALATALPRASHRGFALVLLPAEAWQLWRDWGVTMGQFAEQLRNREVVRTAHDYLAAEMALAARIDELWPEPAPWADGEVIGETRAEAVARRMRSEILTGTLPAGEAIRETELAAQYGVSTTPVREALRLLVADDLVEVEANRRRRVADPGQTEMADRITMIHHLVTWQLRVGLPRITRSQFEELAGLAARLAAIMSAPAAPTRNDDSPGFAALVLEVFEFFARAAGNQEVWTVVRNGLDAVLPHWARSGVRLEPYGRIYRDLAALDHDERTPGVSRLVDELFTGGLDHLASDGPGPRLSVAGPGRD